MESRHAVQALPIALNVDDLRSSSGMLRVSIAASPITAGAASSFVPCTPFVIISSVPACHSPCQAALSMCRETLLTSAEHVRCT